MRWGGGYVLTLVVAAIVGVTLSVLFGHDGIARLLELRAEQQRLGEEAVALLQANASLRDQVKRLESDDRYLETLARRDLGLVRPNETVYRFRRKARPAADR